ncbi:DUF4339 domain-containing protein [Flavobacterium sp. Sd200]|uniref:SPFH domain-containing protein n=1 Tax=Flavobacterium sp. Sd200 TaxID=2692211 RepID=UPI001371F1E0|nr:SPFH domain-containing protein [Flavobacterium sp. Sd200]MXN93162.1 DUF4339 domain-containing protein [Flavobacterium sp. Sd200]
MGLFDIFKGGNGGFMDVIRCDKQEYLVYKWSPNGEANTTKRENAIRFGSSLRIKPNEAVVFLYQQDGSMPDVIKGPLDTPLYTANLPVLTDILGLAYGGETPFMAEIYFFNLQQNIQIKFGIPYFDVFDNRLPDLGIPCSVRGSMTFNISNPINFIKLYRLINFEIDDLEDKIKDLYTRKIKSIILNLPSETGLSVMQLERSIEHISEVVAQKLVDEMESDFGIRLKRLDIGTIELYKTHPNYLQLKGATADQQTRFTNAKTDIEITNLSELARINRKDAEMGIEGRNFTVHQINQQADILKTAAENLGSMGSVNADGFSMPGMAAGITLGSTVGMQMGHMMGNLTNTPPPLPVKPWHIAYDGQQAGPFSVDELRQFIENGQFTAQHHVWKQGMSQWESASNIAEFAGYFAQTPPPLPPSPTVINKDKPASGIDLTKR